MKDKLNETITKSIENSPVKNNFIEKNEIDEQKREYEMSKAEDVLKKFVIDQFEKVTSQNLKEIAENHLEASKQYITDFEKLTIKINSIENDSKERNNRIDEIVQSKLTENNKYNEFEETINELKKKTTEIIN